MKIKNVRNKFFLNLYSLTKKISKTSTLTTQKNILFLKKNSFKKNFLGLLVLYRPISFTHHWLYNVSKLNESHKFIIINYYIQFDTKNPVIFFDKQDKNNLIVFTRPCKQIFFTIFKKKPIFIFTCGLMKYVINEKRKSAKKLYKVALSLLKLSSVIVSNELNFSSCILQLKNTGVFQSKIIQTFTNHKNSIKIKYILLKNNLNTHSQKLGTRRSIKKYVKKRFLLP